MITIREMLTHIPEKDWKEVMIIAKASEQYGGKEIGLTREDLCILQRLIVDKINGNKCELPNLDVQRVWSKLNNLVNN